MAVPSVLKIIRAAINVAHSLFKMNLLGIATVTWTFQFMCKFRKIGHTMIIPVDKLFIT